MASSSSQPNLAQIGQDLLQATTKNIIHETVIHRHRDHKMMVNNLDPATQLPHCERCKLPRLIDPPLAPSVRGVVSEPPSDTVYCDKKPWCRKPGFDIYGNPFLKADVTGRLPTKKEREAAKKKDTEGTPASNEGGDGTAPTSPSADNEANGKPEKLEKGEKKASKIDEKLKKGEYIPWQTCPSCKRSLLITRFAKHLEQCMGLSGRAASRNAMAKINGSTPAGSRGGTPGPSQEGKVEDDEDDDEKIKGPGAMKKKVLKKSLNSKLKKGLGGTNGKIPKSLAAAEGKRDRDEMLLGDEGDEDENVHVKKRQKIQRVGSTTSLASQSTAAPASAIEMERSESRDGSFVDDGGSPAEES